MKITTLDSAGFNFIQKEEGTVLHPYLDSVKIPTIGVGNTYYSDGRKVTMLDKPITLAQATDLFRKVAAVNAAKVSYYITSIVNQDQFNALVSIAYNIGLGAFSKSNLLKKVNANPNDQLISIEFSKWRNAGGEVSKGLVKRREREALMYFSN